MKIGKIERVERKTILLNMGIDFFASDLVDFLHQKHLSEDWQKKHANLGRIVMNGYFDKKTQSIIIKVENDLYIDAELGH